jgi:hypothetical protein
MYILAFLWDWFLDRNGETVNRVSTVPNVDFIDSVMESWTHSNRIEMESEEDTRLLIALTMAATIPAKEAVERFPTLSRLWAGGGRRQSETVARSLVRWRYVGFRCA